MSARRAGAGRREPRSAWDWFPWAVAASLVVVIVINAGMIWTALRTFPGAAGADGFDLSNDYNKVLAAAARQQALGWRFAARLGEGNRIAVRLADRAGAPLAGAQLSAVAERPVGPRAVTPLAFHELVPGRFVADRSLPMGRWDVLLTARAGGQLLTTTVRVVAEERTGR